MDNTPAKERLKNGALPGPFAEFSDPGDFKPSSVGKNLTTKSVIAKSCLTPEVGAVATPSRYRISPMEARNEEAQKERTPMTHIKLGDLELKEEEEKTELDTPNEKKLVMKLTKKMSGGGSFEEGLKPDDETKMSKEKGATRGKGIFEDMYGSWNDYEHVSKVEARRSPEKIQAHQWVCRTCTLVNDKEHALVCEACGSARKDQSAEEKNEPVNWECKNCTFHNTDMDAKKCEICSSRRENESTFEMEIESPANDKEESEGRGRGSSAGSEKSGKTKRRGFFARMFGRK
jgi:hypothetical protein